jgi:hypothetical protein
LSSVIWGSYFGLHLKKPFQNRPQGQDRHEQSDLIPGLQLYGFQAGPHQLYAHPEKHSIRHQGMSLSSPFGAKGRDERYRAVADYNQGARRIEGKTEGIHNG